MIKSGEQGRDLSGLVVSRAGRLVVTGDDREPYRVVGGDGRIADAGFPAGLLFAPKAAIGLPPHAAKRPAIVSRVAAQLQHSAYPLIGLMLFVHLA